MMTMMKKEEDGDLEQVEEKTKIHLKLDKQDKKKKKTKSKKGPNPLKARMKVIGGGGDDSHLTIPSNTRSTSTCGEIGSSSYQVQETVDFSTACCPSSSSSFFKSKSDPEGIPPLPFEASRNGPLLTLLFASAAIQHATLARIETFYESPCEVSSSSSFSSSSSKREVRGIAGGVYRSWKKINEDLGGSTKLCRGYEAFNLPLSSVQEWLGGMYDFEVGGSEHVRAEPGKVEGLESFTDLDLDFDLGKRRGEVEGEGEERKRWYRPFCNEEEVRLLEYLSSLEALDLTPPAPAAAAPARVSQEQQEQEQEHIHSQVEVDLLSTSSKNQKKAPIYLISSLSSTSSTSLPHERLHALYHLSQRYRSRVHLDWSCLSGKAQRVIKHDLTLRGYDARVFLDEWQAYLLGELHDLPSFPLRSASMPGGGRISTTTTTTTTTIQATAIWGPKVKEELSSLVVEMFLVAREEAQIWLPDVHIWR